MRPLVSTRVECSLFQRWVLEFVEGRVDIARHGKNNMVVGIVLFHCNAAVKCASQTNFDLIKFIKGVKEAIDVTTAIDLLSVKVVNNEDTGIGQSL